MKFLLTGMENPELVRAWSGIPYFLSKELRKQQHEVAYFGGLRNWHYLPYHLWGRLYGKLNSTPYRIRAEPDVLKIFAGLLEARIQQEKPDVILSMSCEPTAYLETPLPVYILHDATFHLLKGYYPTFTNLSERQQRVSEEAFQLGFDYCDGSLASSEWARRSVCDDYGIPAERTHVIPFGANLHETPMREEVEAALQARLQDPVKHFLFVGVDWKRKGGEDAVKLVADLVERGVNARLHVVGCQPSPAALKHPFVVAHGFLAKDQLGQAAKLKDLYLKASFFVLPSVAECTPCSFAEANAFGLPVLSRDTGGISEIIRPGINGYLLSATFSMEAMVETMRELCGNPGLFLQKALLCRHEYETRLNWTVYVDRLEALIQSNS